MKEDSLKKRLRALKRQEKLLRVVPGERLLFGKYFFRRFGLSFLQALDENALSMVIDEYWADVIFTYFKENGLSAGVKNPELLTILGLSYDAGEEDIKRRFRQLAKRLHPDHGGDAGEFMKIYEAYEQLK